ncbi:MAG: hypothetical protein ACKVU1_04440 [bacterium]
MKRVADDADLDPATGDDDGEFEADLHLVATVLPRPTGKRERPFPGEVRVTTKGLLAFPKSQSIHGYHSAEAVEIPTTLTCNLCPLYHVKRKNRRHHLACPEGRRDAICPILTRKQIAWASELMNEVRQTSGRDPSASQLATVEQIVRYRSRLFQIENYLKVAGLIDLREGQVRAVADRLGGVESGLTRALGELRQSMSDGRDVKHGAKPTLPEYLDALVQAQAARRAIEEAARKENFTSIPAIETEEGS